MKTGQRRNHKFFIVTAVKPARYMAVINIRTHNGPKQRTRQTKGRPGEWQQAVEGQEEEEADRVGKCA